MKTTNPDHPIRNTLKHLALALTMGAAMFFGASPANATPVTTGLALWLDASDASTMTITGGTVDEWRDKNGSAAKMTRDNGAPTVEVSGIGGFPTVHFTSGSSMGDGVNHAAPVTVFYVSRQTGGDNGRVLSGGNNWLLGYHGGNRNSAYFEGWVCNEPASDTNPHLYAATIPGFGYDSTVWAEGAQIAKNQNGTDGPNGLFVGGGGAYSEYSDCDISEVLVYNRILDSTELLAVGGYLTAKYGLTTTYPTGLTARLTSPANNQAFVSGTTPISATATVLSGAAPYTVQFYKKVGAGSFAPEGSPLAGAGPTFSLSLVNLVDETYQIYAEVTDSAAPAVTVTSATNTFMVAPAEATTTTVVSSGSPSVYGDSVTFTATVAPVPTGGTVQFKNGGSSLGSPVAVTAGVATVTTTTLGVVGPNNITAEYSGYQIYDPSTTAASISQEVTKAPLTVTAQNVFRFQNTPNPDPLPYQITGYQNGEDFASSGVSREPILSTDAVLESLVGPYPITCDVTNPLPGMSADNYSFTPVNGILTVVDPATPFGINVNFTGGTAETESALSGPAGGLGTIWNQFVGPDSPGPLLQSAGPATTVTIDTNFGLEYTFDDPVVDLPILRGSMTDFGKGRDDINVTISGLEAGGFYDIWLVTLRNQGYGGDGTEQYVGWWSTTNTTSSPGNQLVNAVSPTINTSTFVAGYNYVLFENVVANGSGQIVFTGVAGDQLDGSDDNHRLGLNGLQLVEVPPATIKSFGTNVVGSSAVIGLPVAGAATIDWTVPYASGSTPELLAALAPTYTLSSGTCDQPNDGITPPVPDFSAGPVPYTVEDTVNVVTNVYTVTVTVAPPPLPEFRWTGAGDGNWTDVANWNNTVPGAADIAILSDSDTAGATLTLDADAAVAGLTFNNLVADQVIASPDGKTLTLASGASLTVEGTHSISANVDITLGTKLGSGSVNLSGTVAAHNAAANGIAMFVSEGVLGISGTTTVDPGKRVRVDGSGTLEVTGVLNTAGTLFPVGSGGSTDTATVILKGSGQWNQTHTTGGDIAIGISGTNNGKLIIQDTAQLNSAFMVLGLFGTCAGTVQQDGGTVTLVTTPADYTALARPALWIGVSGPGDYHLNGGTLNCGSIGGSGKLYFNGGTLVANMDDLIIVDPGGVLSTAVGQDSFMQGLNQVVVQSGAVIDTAGHIITIAQNLEHDSSGPAIDGGLTKQGLGTLTLLGTNTYTGATKVQGGTLAFATAASVAPTALEIAAAAKVNLNYTGNQNIPSLKVGATVMPDGVYGSSSSPAPLANQDDVHFAGTGTVTVGGSSGFTSWATANGATGQTPQQDHDNDGVENGIEYFMGQTGSSFTAMPGLDGTNTVSWTASAAYQGTYEVQTSTDLVTWTNVDPRPTPSGGTLSYTLPADAPGGKSFVRLLVTPAP